MDPQTNQPATLPSQPSNTPVPQVPVNQPPQEQPAPETVNQPVSPKSSGSMLKTILLILVGLLALIGVAGTSYYLGTQRVNPIHQTGVDVPLNQKKSVTQQPTPTPDPTAGWQTYSSTKYSYSVKYPTTLVATEDNTYYHTVTFKTATGSATLPEFVTAVIPETFTAKDVAAYNYMSSDWIGSLYVMKTGDTQTTPSGAVFTRLPDTIVDGQSAIAVGVTATGYKQERVYTKKNGDIYMFSNYYSAPEELTNFQLFLSSVKFSQ